MPPEASKNMVIHRSVCSCKHSRKIAQRQNKQPLHSWKPFPLWEFKAQANIKRADHDFRTRALGKPNRTNLAEDLKDLPLLHGEDTLEATSTRRRSHLLETNRNSPAMVETREGRVGTLVREGPKQLQEARRGLESQRPKRNHPSALHRLPLLPPWNADLKSDIQSDQYATLQFLLATWHNKNRTQKHELACPLIYNSLLHIHYQIILMLYPDAT